MLQQMLQEGTFQSLISKEKDFLAQLTLNNEFLDEDYLIDEEPIVIKMLDSMLSRKKTVQERLDLNMMLPTSESVKKELRNLLIQEEINRNKEELAQAEYERLVKCEELYERFQRVVQERQKEYTVATQKSSNRT